MGWKNIFKLNLIKLVIAIVILVISGFLSNELFIVCKPGADCTPPIYSYLFGIIFLIDILYIIISIIYTVYFKIRGKK